MSDCDDDDDQSLFSLVLKDVSSLGRHTVDAPVGLAIVVADGDAEPAIVGSHDLDRLLRIAGYDQLVPFACVSSTYGRLPRSFAACNKQKKLEETGFGEQDKQTWV